MNNINSRYKRMDEFLKKWRDIAIENPGLDFHDETLKNAIYKDLTRYGVTEDEKKCNLAIEGVFDNWIERYKQVPNINVFVANDWRYFCQFTNQDKVFGYRGKEAIKIYIPLDRDHIENGANLIFDYLAKKNITHQSKVGKNIRMDDIVIRLNSEKDAKDLLQFVNNQKYIQEGLIEPNPFAYNNNRIALACDRFLSYNDTISSLLAIYIDKRKEEKKLDKIKLSDFVSFVAQYYNERFERFEKTDTTLSDFCVRVEDLDEQEISANLINLKEITTLFLSSTNLLFSLNNYLEHYQKGTNSKEYRNQVLELTSLRRKKEENLDVNAMISYIVDTMGEEYSEDYVVALIDAYLKTGETSYLTRKNNIRKKVSNSSFRDILNKVIQESNISFEEYYKMIKEEKKEEYLENAILETYDKYQKKYELGQETITGKSWAIGALKRLLVTRKYDCFTNDNNARKKLRENVSVEDVTKIARKKTNYPTMGSSTMSPEEAGILSEDYVSRILTDRMEKEKHTMMANSVH